MTQEIITPITTPAELAALCQRLSGDTVLTVDTEFMRERTYFPQLCLVQVAGEHEAAIIDALAPDLADPQHWTPFWALMTDARITKVFHAVRQDIEIFVHLAGIVPAPLFDTQIAAMAIGFQDQVSYARLAEAMTGDYINKEEQYTDWTVRPLRPAQLTYALQDVTILRKVYLAMQEKLQHLNRHAWLQEEMQGLADINYYRVNPDTLWERLKMRSNRPQSWAALKALAAWREREAIRVNRPRQTVLKDDVLTQIAMTVPVTQEALAKTRGIPNYIASGAQTEHVLKLLQDAKQATPASMPKRQDGPTLSAAQEDQLELVKLALKIVARQQNVSTKLIASNEDLNNFIAKPGDAHLTHGWRGEIFGQIALELMHGQAALKIKDGKLVLEK